MKKIRECGEFLISKVSHPNFAIKFANWAVDGQNVQGYEDALIGRNCILRGDIQIGCEVRIAGGCEIRIDVTIGDRSNIGSQTEIIGDVSIGKYCAIARDVVCQEPNHNMRKPAHEQRFYKTILNTKNNHVSDGQISIGNDVWIGTKSVILSGVNIGNGAVIGAGSVVTHDVEPYAIVAGTPAERVNWRFEKDIRERLLTIKWWDWNESKIRKNSQFFQTEINCLEDIEKTIID